jgi:hypothetical protein
MARWAGVPKSIVGRIWRKFDLKPHMADAFKLSADPLFVEKVVDLYHDPPDKAVVLRVDEKPQIHAAGQPGARRCARLRLDPRGDRPGEP